MSDVREFCWRCGEGATHRPCCSSHDRPMCCDHYRRAHFVEVRPCCTADRVAMAPQAPS